MTSLEGTVGIPETVKVTGVLKLWHSRHTIPSTDPRHLSEQHPRDDYNINGDFKESLTGLELGGSFWFANCAKKALLGSPFQ